jgi:arylsulfatase A-like enzyme
VWAPTVETDAALAAIDAFGDDPFALVLSYGPPHPDPAWPTNWDDVPPELMAEVDPLALQLRPNLPTEMLYPNKKLEGNQLDPTGALAFLQGYYACILGVDREIGRLLDGLDARGLTQDTLVVFLSDHGEMGGSQSRYRKGVAYEEVVRVPFVARWPGVLAPARVAGAANLTDVTPTILGLLGAPPLVGATGRDRSSWLRNGAAPDAAESSFLWYHEVEGAWRGLRSARWKYAEAEIGDLLFDLEADPYEMTNLATDPDYAEVVEARAAELDALQEEAADPLLSV